MPLDAPRTDPFSGIYIGSFGPHGPEALQVRRSCAFLHILDLWMFTHLSKGRGSLPNIPKLLNFCTQHATIHNQLNYTHNCEYVQLKLYKLSEDMLMFEYVALWTQIRGVEACVVQADPKPVPSWGKWLTSPSNTSHWVF